MMMTSVSIYLFDVTIVPGKLIQLGIHSTHDLRCLGNATEAGSIQGDYMQKQGYQHQQHPMKSRRVEGAYPEAYRRHRISKNIFTS
jgi:hypothetical protein